MKTEFTSILTSLTGFTFQKPESFVKKIGLTHSIIVLTPNSNRGRLKIRAFRGSTVFYNNSCSLENNMSDLLIELSFIEWLINNRPRDKFGVRMDLFKRKDGKTVWKSREDGFEMSVFTNDIPDEVPKPIHAIEKFL